eukprot:CAMPEP_0201559634 /NCGR_PEP_ID=MMETSP0173_2-20130828/75287_1 /ASSEMBLY_ACC=CAM_ASM_000268 /TAXON_ID=218659 /ORGANISM="Vexillifera sp., Strain DIVA3 564/2" /LENGTH=149 /DNA_ID=CAMNT_0047973789 /DNA_START=342 /DNA_END=787 /DNA_ORIENTATION=-
MSTNFNGAIYCAHFAGKYLAASKHKSVFAVLSSVAGEISPPYVGLYAAAKHAVHGAFESLQNEEPGYSVVIACPSYVASEISETKVLADGSSGSVALALDKSKEMSVETAAKLIYEGIQKRKKYFHLTTSGSLGTTLKALFPGTINAAV